MGDPSSPLGFLRNLSRMIVADPIDNRVYPERGVRFPSGKVATKSVAASDADPETKLFADYVCDGTADDGQIQAAIDGLPAGGGKVVLSDGTFSIAAQIDLPTDRAVNIEGSGSGSFGSTTGTVLDVP